MEVFQQFRLLFLVLMAFLSYHYVDTTLSLPPSVDSEEEECQNVVENESGSVKECNQSILSSQGLQIQLLQVSEQKDQIPQITQGEVIQINDQVIDLQAEFQVQVQDSYQESQMNEQEQISQNVLANVENLQSTSNEKGVKTKRIKKGKKKGTKKSVDTIQIADPIQGQYLIV